jgi:hypothetical protein
MAAILAVAEQRDGSLRRISEEATTAAANVAEKLSAEVHVLIAGASAVAAAASSLGKFGAAKVLVAESPAFAQYDAEALAQLIADQVKGGDYTAVIFGGSSFGNTTGVGAAAGGSRALAAGTACGRSDCDIVEGFADLSTSVSGRPLRFFVDYAQNTEAEVNPTVNEKLDTALGAGFSYGAASAAKGTWEFGVTYQQVEKDALFGQLVDSVFGDGNTDTNGYVLRGGYTVARNWTLNASLFLNDLSNDVPQSVTLFNEATAAPYDTTVVNGIIDRDYKRLQLDLNFRF